MCVSLCVWVCVCVCVSNFHVCLGIVRFVVYCCCFRYFFTVWTTQTANCGGYCRCCLHLPHLAFGSAGTDGEEEEEVLDALMDKLHTCTRTSSSASTGETLTDDRAKPYGEGQREGLTSSPQSQLQRAAPHRAKFKVKCKQGSERQCCQFSLFPVKVATLDL